MPTIPSHLDTVQRARELYRDRSGLDRAHAICAFVTWTHRDEGWGRFAKGDGFSADVIALKVPGEAKVFTFDILVDVENEGRPQWNATQPTGRGDLSRWRAAVEPPPVLGPQPQPKPEPVVQPAPEPLPSVQAQPVDLTPVRDALARLDQQVADLTARLAALEAAEYRVEGNTSRSLGHAHSVVASVARVR